MPGITWSLATPPSWHYVGVVGPVPFWEMDLWHRQLIAKMTGQAIQATVKLHQLLQQLPAMPVSDGIGYTIARGINYISKTSRSAFYSFALERAQVALKQSENAFYDESLLAQVLPLLRLLGDTCTQQQVTYADSQRGVRGEGTTPKQAGGVPCSTTKVYRFVFCVACFC